MHKPIKYPASSSSDSWILTTVIVLIAFGCLCIAALFVYGRQFSFSGMTFTGEKSQKTESGQINPSVDTIEIINRHGKVGVLHQSELGWNWELTTWADTQEKADELRDQVKLDVSENNGKQTWELVLPEDLSQCNGIKSDLVLRVPLSVKGVVTNRHGATTISDIKGGITINSEHGDVECRSCPCAVEIQSRHGNVVLQDFVGLTGNFRHGNLTIEGSSAAITVDSEHGDIRVRDVQGDLELKAGYGDVDATGIQGNVSIKNRHADIDVECFAETVKCSNRHADTTVRIDNQAVKSVDISGKHNDIDLSLPGSLQPRIRATVSHGDVHNDFESNDGSGPLVELATSHGDIRIRKHEVVPAEQAATAEASDERD